MLKDYSTLFIVLKITIPHAHDKRRLMDPVKMMDTEISFCCMLEGLKEGKAIIPLRKYFINHDIT